MTMSLVLVDDWELRGDGSGDMRRIQFDTMRQLNRIYEEHGLRGSYNAEIMQQLNHLRLGAKHPELQELAQEWEDVVLEAYRRGHDVQLHVHSQWSRPVYENGRWTLGGDWSIINHPREAMVRMISECRTYLEALIRRVDPAYRCVSFRSGAWAIAPSEHILSVLAEQGIVFDMSICDGIKYDNAVIKLDYTRCEEAFLPFYPDPTDARRIGDGRLGLICVPTLSFRPSRANMWKRDASIIVDRIRSRVSSRSPAVASNADYSVWKTKVASRSLASRMGDRVRSRLNPELRIADLSALTFDLMRDMIDTARRRAAERRVTHLPLILENHTKDITNFDDIKRFAAYLAKQPDLEVITLKELAARLSAGVYQIVSRQAGTERKSA